LSKERLPKGRLLVIFPALLAVIMLAGISYLGSELSYSNMGISFVTPKVGTTLIYQITASGEPLSSPYAQMFLSRLQQAGPAAGDNYTFFFVLTNNYDSAVNQQKASGGVELNESIDCLLVAHQAFIIVEILNEGQQTTQLGTTFMLKDGYAKCGPNYGPLPVIDNTWSSADGYYEAHFGIMNITRVITIENPSMSINGSFVNADGPWPLWLGQNITRPGLVLYNIDDLVSIDLPSTTPFDGEAYVLMLSPAETSYLPYDLSGIQLPATSLVYVERGIIYGRTVISNISWDAASMVERIINKENSCENNQQCGLIANDSLFPLRFNYVNQSLTINGEPPSPLVPFQTGWKFETGLASPDATTIINGTTYHYTYYYTGVAVNNSTFFTIGFPGLDYAYYTKTGMFLYLSINSADGQLTSILPTQFIRTFGILPFSSAGNTTISFGLIKITN
jgi:hypothetical protein